MGVRVVVAKAAGRGVRKRFEKDLKALESANSVLQTAYVKNVEKAARISYQQQDISGQRAANSQLAAGLRNLLGS